MGQKLETWIQEIRERHGKTKLWKQALSFLMAVTVFTTTYALILPAVTMEKTYCGKEEHTHSVENGCYVELRKLICTKGEIHTHTDACYAQQSPEACTVTESEGHTHTDACYKEKKTLTCKSEEAEGHAHSDECGAEEKILICEAEEKEGHAHTEACYEEQTTLTCTQEEAEGHAHSEACYDEGGNLICGREESEGHAHADACYKTEKILICEKEEAEGHAHADACYEVKRITSCGKEETEGHKHTDACYEIEKVLTCKQEEKGGHTHTPDCKPAADETAAAAGTEKILICKEETGASTHVHTDACYETTLELSCEKEEHKHSKACYSDPQADVERSDIWENSLAGVKLTGVWADDVLAIADSQLGYRESVKNYTVVGDDIKGYTRYGAWYGDEYGDWCAMFVSFCVRYAQIDKEFMPIESVCEQWMQKLTRLGMFHRSGDMDGYNIKPGDLIFFERSVAGRANHIGLVYSLIKNEADEIIQIKTIEGNSADMVRYKTYSITDGSILGYGELPENPQEVAKIESGIVLERSTPKLDFAAVEESRELLDFYLSPVVRVLTPVDMTGKTFTQAIPTEEDIPNDTFYRFGYNAPEDAEHLYENEAQAIYTAYASPMEYPDRVVVSYRVYGSIDGGENAWYVCDIGGEITHRVEEREVEWDLSDFDILTPGEYTIVGTVDVPVETQEVSAEGEKADIESTADEGASGESADSESEATEALVEPLTAELCITISEISEITEFDEH